MSYTVALGKIVRWHVNGRGVQTFPTIKDDGFGWIRFKAVVPISRERNAPKTTIKVTVYQPLTHWLGLGS